MSDLPARPDPGFPERSLAVRRAAARLCGRLGWAPLHEVTLPNFRRADILALRGDGGLVCIEVKSGARDFLTDTKWPQYRDFSDALYFAVDGDFPLDLLPEEAGWIVAADGAADILREAPAHPLAPARRGSLLQRFASLAALRLAALEDPAGAADLRAALRAE
ncbi:MAG TPA: MmcB family DNA repair protein [Acetobacteraceae bacterium]|nr:MmcB family DNA repair protein [Acetobacteraceae bacterium]